MTFLHIGVMRCHFIRVCMLCMAALPAHASSPVSDVGSAIVEAGRTSVEWRMGGTEDSADTRLRTRAQIDHGFNDWYALRVVALQDRREGDSYEHDAFIIQNRFQLIEKKDYGFDAGVRLVYTKKDGDKTPDDVDVALLTQVPFGNYEWRSNAIFEREVGADQSPGLILELRNQITYDFGAFAAGIDLFSDFGKLRDSNGWSRAAHDMGPVIKGNVTDAVYYQAGYRAGLSEGAADHLFKFFIGMHF